MKKILRFAVKYFYALGSSLMLFTVGFLVRRNRELISNICSHFGYGRRGRCPPPPLAIPQTPLKELLSDDTRIQIREPVKRDGNVSLLETVTINNIVAEFAPRAIFEIGTFDGRTTLNMAANCAPGASVFTLDLPKRMIEETGLALAPGDEVHIDKDRSGLRFQDKETDGEIIELFGDSARFNFSPYENGIDLVFIDGSHSYDYVLNDSNAALRLLRNRTGIVLWHDYGGWPGVTQALNHLYTSDRRFSQLQHIERTSLVIGRFALQCS